MSLYIGVLFFRLLMSRMVLKTAGEPALVLGEVVVKRLTTTHGLLRVCLVLDRCLQIEELVWNIRL